MIEEIRIKKLDNGYFRIHKTEESGEDVNSGELDGNETLGSVARWLLGQNLPYRYLTEDGWNQWRQDMREKAEILAK